MMKILEIVEEGAHWIAFPDPTTTIVQLVAACRELGLVPLVDPEELRLGVTPREADQVPPTVEDLERALYGDAGADYLVETGRFRTIVGPSGV